MRKRSNGTARSSIFNIFFICSISVFTSLCFFASASATGTTAYWELDGEGNDSVGSYDLVPMYDTSVINPGNTLSAIRIAQIPGPDSTTPWDGGSHSDNSLNNPGSAFYRDNYAYVHQNPLVGGAHDNTFDFNATRAFTVEGWVQIDSVTPTFVVGNRTGNASNSLGGAWRGWDVRVQGGGTQMVFYVDGGINDSRVRQVFADIEPGKMTHFAAAWDPSSGGTGEMRLFIDGRLQDSNIGSANWGPDRGGQLSIGGRDAGSGGYNSWIGDEARIDEVRFSDDALAPQEFLNYSVMPHLSTIAVTRAVVPGAPVPSDVQFSARFIRDDTGNGIAEPDNEIAMMQAFHATRNDWTFSNDPAVVSQIVAAGISHGGGSSPTFHSIQQSINEGWAAIDWKGNYLGKPRLRDSELWNPDINSDTYRNIKVAQIGQLTGGGGVRMHFDDPPLNAEMALLADDPVLGLEEGVYSPDSVAGFRSFLSANTTVSQRTTWGIPNPNDLSAFDYKDFVDVNNGSVDQDLHDQWIEFHFQSTEDFYAELRQRVSAQAGFNVPFSGNNYKDGSRNMTAADHPLGRIYSLFDWWIGELDEVDAKPVILWEDTRKAESLDKRQVFTLKSTDVLLNRQVIAQTYALGTHMVAPWDVFLDGNTGQGNRFYGDPADYADLFSFVRNHDNLYDGYESAADIGPGIVDLRYTPGSEPVSIVGGTDEVFAMVRAVPGDPDSPIVIHLVDWGDVTEGFDLILRNEMFGWLNTEAIGDAVLIRPGEADLILSGSFLAGLYTEFSLPALDPYALLVITPPAPPSGPVPEPSSIIIMLGLSSAGLLCKRSVSLE